MVRLFGDISSKPHLTNLRNHDQSKLLTRQLPTFETITTSQTGVYDDTYYSVYIQSNTGATFNVGQNTYSLSWQASAYQAPLHLARFFTMLPRAVQFLDDWPGNFSARFTWRCLSAS